MRGQSADDSIRGEDANDWIRGGDGDDTISGGAGNDTLWGEAGTNRLAESVVLGDLTVGDTEVFGSETGNDAIREFEQLQISGGSGDNRLDLSPDYS